MGLFGGDDDGVDATVREVEASLPDGWRLKRVKHQLVGRRPVKHDTYGAVANGPGGKVAAFSLDGSEAVRGVAALVAGTATPAATWAPPALEVAEPQREPWASLTATDEEDAARASLEAAVVRAGGGVLSPVDEERFAGGVTVFAITLHRDDGTGVAAFALDELGAYAAMEARLDGRLPPTPVWHVRL